MLLLRLIFFLCLLFHLVLTDHYKGGTISWKPLNPTAISGATVDIVITQRHSWTLSRYPCDETMINTFGIYNDTNGDPPASLSCISSSAICASSLYQTINASLLCTDFSTVFQISTGTHYTTQSLAINSVFDVAMRGASWATELLTNAWSLVSHIDLTPISGKINTSPVTGSLPIFQTYVGVTRDIQILLGDVDYDQVVRCRWSNQLPLDECGDVCLNLPNARLNPDDCIITWTPVLRPEDVANGLNSSTYVVAITAEDFVNASSTIPLSSAAHQILVHASSKPPNSCSNRPTVSAFPRRNLACYGVTPGGSYNYNFRGAVRTFCPNDTIVDFISFSPLFTTKSVLYKVTNFTWGVNITWTANTNQTGLQPFCVAAVDNFGQSSDQYCVMIMVNSANPTFFSPTFVQSSASPIGTVMATQTRFSIQASLPLRRTTLNSTLIVIRRLDNNALVRQIDCKYSPDVYFLNTTLIFFVPNPPWILGVTYYISMSQGVATAAYLFCGTEGGGFSSTAVWRFTIWNPAASSTTTLSTTTTNATVPTVTTRFIGTSTANPLFTTTGIPLITVTTITTTTATTSTSATTTTTTSATTTTTTTASTTEYIPDANVINPKDLERICLQPITVATVIVTVAMLPLHLFAMITLFSKMNLKFDKDVLRTRNERRIRLQAANDEHEAEHESFV